MSETNPTALPPLDDELASLIGAERRHPGPPSGTAERVRAAVLVTTAAAVAVGSGATLAASTTASVAASVTTSSSLGASTTAASTLGTSGMATSTGVLAGLSGAAKSGAVVVAALAATAGGSIFVANYDVAPADRTAALVVEDGARPAPPVGLVVEPAPAEPTPAPPPTTTTTTQRPRPPATPKAALPKTTATPPTTTAVATDLAHEQALGVERAIIAEARAALVRGDGDRALIILESHRSAWPTGLLVEEREALTVMALHSAGQDGPARAAAARFRQRWPASLFLDAIGRQVP